MHIHIHQPGTPTPTLSYKDFPETGERPGFSTVEIQQGDDMVTIFLPYLYRFGKPNAKAEA